MNIHVQKYYDVEVFVIDIRNGIIREHFKKQKVRDFNNLIHETAFYIPIKIIGDQSTQDMHKIVIKMYVKMRRAE